MDDHGRFLCGWQRPAGRAASITNKLPSLHVNSMHILNALLSELQAHKLLPHAAKEISSTLYNQKHATRFKRSTDPLCPLPGCHQLGSTLYMLSGCRNHIIPNMKTERHNVARRMIIKALRA
eukprot:1160711-Pelagomonas_calceolata.AAC.3